MAMWHYQMSQEEWTPERYRLEVWEGERWRWPVGKIHGADRPASGDRVVFFFAKTGCPEPGFYGWAVVLECEEKPSRFYFRPVAPSDQLKMYPWWDEPGGTVAQITDQVRVPIKEGTLWHVPDQLAPVIGAGIAGWVGCPAQGLAKACVNWLQRPVVYRQRGVPVTKSYDYILAVWLCFAVSRAPAEFLEELREYLEAEYQIIKLEIVEESESDRKDELTVSMQVQLTFHESQMDGEDPTEEALGEIDRELRPYLEAKYEVTYFELLDDALTSYLLAEREEPVQRKYPDQKQRELTDDEKKQLRARIAQGDADVYALATEFGCSASQIAGIKAAMHR
jgi:hypothetical protein